jgi:hypothetical protein
MVHRNNAGKLLSFPPPRPVPGSPAENWSLRILETKDNLISALDFLRIAYNEMLAGRPVKSIVEVLARVEAILRNDAEVPAYTVVAAIRIDRSRLKRNEKSHCSFPQFKALHVRRPAVPIKTRAIEGTSPDEPVDGVATILEQEAQATINDWFQRSMVSNLLLSSPLEESLRTSHLPELLRDLVNRLRHPLPERALSPHAAAHGLLRRRQGYTAAMLVEESRVLEVSIFHTLHTNAHRIDFNVLLPDVMVIADEVDSHLAQAMASYTAV